MGLTPFSVLSVSKLPQDIGQHGDVTSVYSRDGAEDNGVSTTNGEPDDVSMSQGVQNSLPLDQTV